MLLPTTFAIEIELLFNNAASVLTANSGKEVPKLTRVKPITNSLIPKCLAMCVDESIKYPEPFIRKNKPMMNIKKVRSIII